MEQPIERGPWKIIGGPDGQLVIGSDDFTHDVWLYVTGDFADDTQRQAYAELIRDRLNATPQDQHARSEGYKHGLTVGWDNGRKNALEEIETKRSVAVAQPQEEGRLTGEETELEALLAQMRVRELRAIF